MLILSKIHHDIYVLKERLSYLFQEVLSLLCVKVYLSLIISLNISLWVFVWLFYNKVREDMIILHYNVDFGVGLIGRPSKIFIIPALGLFAAVFNFLLLPVFAKRNDLRFVSHLVLATALLVNILLSLSLGPLYIINFN